MTTIQISTALHTGCPPWCTTNHLRPDPYNQGEP